jgi:hypothetical protein
MSYRHRRFKKQAWVQGHKTFFVRNLRILVFFTKNQMASSVFPIFRLSYKALFYSFVYIHYTFSMRSVTDVNAMLLFYQV